MKTVRIKPVTAYVNGKQMTAEAISVVSVCDNLFDHVVFKYTLFDAACQWSGEASYELKGIEQYQTWDASPEGAYAIVAAGIGLEFEPAVGKLAFFEGAE